MRFAWILSLLASSALAQQAGTGVPADGGTSEVLQSIFIPPKPFAPFTLTLATEWIRPMGDGDTVTLTNRRTIARDVHGRIMEERRLLVPPHGDSQTVLTWIQLADPEQHTLYNCSPAQRVCHLSEWNQPQTGQQTGEQAPEAPEGSTMYPGFAVATKDLGRDMKAGVEVRGTRVTTTIEAGKLGNRKPIVIKREFWFSDVLGFNVVSLRQDPRFGQQRFTVTELSQDAPDPAVFALPEGFAVIDERAPAPQ